MKIEKLITNIKKDNRCYCFQDNDKSFLDRLFIRKEYVLRDYFFQDIKKKYNLKEKIKLEYKENRSFTYSILDYYINISLNMNHFNTFSSKLFNLFLYQIFLSANSEDLEYFSQIKLNNIAYKLERKYDDKYSLF